MNYIRKVAPIAGIASLPVMYYLFKRYIAGGACKSKARMEDKTVLITGANAGIGKETAIDIAKRGGRVIMACRDMTRGEASLNDVVQLSGNSKVVLKQLDLASLKSIREFAEDINKTEPELHVLINNAGVMVPSQLQRTQDGFELQMGVNHLGHFLLTNLLLDLIKSTKSSRIVVVSSIAHGMNFTTPYFNFDNMNGEKYYKKWDAYGQSKLANIMCARELAKRLDGTDVTVNSLHPGAIKTDLSRHLGFFESIGIRLMFIFFKTPQQGAQTNIHLAVSEEVEGVTGQYFVDCKVKQTAKAAQDDAAAKKLWDISAQLVGLETTI